MSTDWHKFAVRLAKLMEMLRSPYDGERIAATERMNELLDSVGLTYTEFLLRQVPPESEPVRRPRPGEAEAPTHVWRQREQARREQARKASEQSTEDLAYCGLAVKIMRHEGFTSLGERSRSFVEQMAKSWKRAVSPSQRNWLDGLAEQIGISSLREAA